jgi:FKBP-type peptidyl-prolyl cis-trans isomerase FkpA
MIVFRRMIPLIVLLALASACGSDSSSTAPTPPTSVGVFTQTDLVLGIGPVANTGSRVTVTEMGWLYDTGKPLGKGTQFDSGHTFTFAVGDPGYVAGFSQGIVGMRVGGQRRLIIPPELGYGSNPPAGSGIPVNATLVFDITLTSAL